MELSENGFKNSDFIYEKLEAAFNSALLESCPIELMRSFAVSCLSESADPDESLKKSSDELLFLLKKTADFRADKQDLKKIKDISKSLSSVTDNVVCSETAKIIHKSLSIFENDYLSHIDQKTCDKSFKRVPCSSSCPAHVDIPGYIALTNAGRYSEAIELIRKDNPFPSVCGFVCEHPCEQSCRRGSVDLPVNIREIKRFAAENSKAVSLPKKASSTGKTIAIIGGGPSGLTAAYYLAIMGHSVTVYEKRNMLGGMLRYGIPRYRLPASYLDNDIDTILSLGIDVKLGVDIGKSETFENIKNNFDFVYISIGAHIGKKLGIDGEASKGVFSAVDFLRKVEEKENFDFSGKKVTVIGGGNVAVDAARTSIRLGAEKVTCVYRRRIEDMKTLPGELENAVAEGCEMLALLAPKEIISDKSGNVKEVIFAPQIIAEDERGKSFPRDSGAQNVSVPSDIVISAIGQVIESEHFSESGVKTNGGVFLTDETGSVSGIENIFSGGDCVTGPSTVIKAIEAGKKAALAINKTLGTPLPQGSRKNIPFDDIVFSPDIKRQSCSERPVEERTADFKIVERGLSEDEVHYECSRCLRCDRRGITQFKTAK